MWSSLFFSLPTMTVEQFYDDLVARQAQQPGKQRRSLTLHRLFCPSSGISSSGSSV